MSKPAMSKKKFLEKCKLLGVTDPFDIDARVENQCGNTEVIQFNILSSRPLVTGRIIQTVNRRYGYENQVEYRDRVQNLVGKYQSWLRQENTDE